MRRSKIGTIRHLLAAAADVGLHPHGHSGTRGVQGSGDHRPRQQWRRLRPACPGPPAGHAGAESRIRHPGRERSRCRRHHRPVPVRHRQEAQSQPDDRGLGDDRRNPDQQGAGHSRSGDAAGLLDRRVPASGRAADSPIKSLRDLIDKFKADPGSVSWGGLAVGSPTTSCQAWLSRLWAAMSVR